MNLHPVIECVVSRFYYSYRELHVPIAHDLYLVPCVPISRLLLLSTVSQKILRFLIVVSNRNRLAESPVNDKSRRSKAFRATLRHQMALLHLTFGL